MKRAYVLFAMALAIGACSDSNNPVTASDPNVIKFVAQLSPAEETPPISGPEATGKGTANIQLNVTRDAGGNLTSAGMTFDVTLSGFPPTTAISAAHIHPGRTGVPGGVLVSTTLASGEVTMANGAGSFVKSNISVPVAQAQSIMNDPAAFYFNVHSAANPTGVARGQLVRQ
jgi:hypothetical protein